MPGPRLQGEPFGYFDSSPITFALPDVFTSPTTSVFWAGRLPKPGKRKLLSPLGYGA